MGSILSLDLTVIMFHCTTDRSEICLKGRLKICLHVLSPSPSNCYHCANGTDCFTKGMGSVSILPVNYV